MNPLAELIAKARGQNPEEEDAIKKKADQAAARNQLPGEQEEPGIEHDPYSEAAATMAAGPIAGGLKAAGRSALRFGEEALAEPAVAQGGYIGSKAAEGAKKAWFELTEAERTNFPGGFAEYVRKAGEAPGSNLGKLKMPEANTGTLDYSSWAPATKSKVTEATTGFQPRPGIRVNPKLK